LHAWSAAITMNYFRYKLIEPSGEISSGVINLPYEEVMSAISYLERDGAASIYVKKLSRSASFLLQIGSLKPRRKISRPIQAELLNNMSLMLHTGVTLVGALQEVAESADFHTVSKDISEIISRIQSGSSFSEAAEIYPNIFPKSVVYLIRIGEETGQLDKMLKDASDHLKRMQAIISDTKQALMYPSIVIVVMTIGMIFWFYSVVPKILSLFSDLDVALPPITIFLVKISDFVQVYILHIVLGTGLVVAAIVVFRKRSRMFRKALDQLLLRLPLSGTIISASVLAYLTEYFSLLISSGIDIIQSLKILEKSIRNEVFRDKILAIGEEIGRGETIAESFRHAIIFPSFVVRVISIGEMSGTLSDQLQYIAEEYRNKLALLVATIGKMIEPIVLVIAGVLFAIIIVGLFLPIYDLVSRIQGV
jgi:type II secretory pathway component PulF